MAISPSKIYEVSEKYFAIKDCLNEKGRRLWAAVEAQSCGRGGIALVCRATGISNATIHKGIKELKSPIGKDRVRKEGGGRKRAIDNQPGLLSALDKLVDPYSKGDPETPLKWTTKSVRNLTNALKAQGFNLSRTTTGSLLHKLGYSLQANKKTLESASHNDRDAQFIYINDSVKSMQYNAQPAISVDTKKKENIGNYKNNGREYSRKGKPREVKGHDFPNVKLGKVVPYGIYDIGRNKGWVSVGISSDTAKFAVNAIRTWWYSNGINIYPNASKLLITADCGGSNGYRTRLWKLELQKFATETGLNIHVRHFPPGTSKWNKIEHRLFSYISKNWRGKPLINHETVVSLIANTKTEKGLTVSAVLDRNHYKTGIKVTDKDMANINLRGDKFHPEWNYSIIAK
jgi:transposase